MAEFTSRTLGDIDLRAGSPTFGAPVATPVDPAIDERLARVEKLLDADLDLLGPSVVTMSIDEITTRLDSLNSAVDTVGTRWDQIAEPLDDTLALRVSQRLDSVDKRVDRLTLLIEAATAPEPDGYVSPTDLALRGILARLDTLAAEVSRLSAIAERVDGAG